MIHRVHQQNFFPLKGGDQLEGFLLRLSKKQYKISRNCFQDPSHLNNQGDSKEILRNLSDRPKLYKRCIIIVHQILSWNSS